MSARRAELAANLTQVRSRVVAAAAAAGRSPDEVAVVVVTKRFPASDVDHLIDLGVRHIGENKDQEALPKVAELLERSRVRVHFVGQLQSNKAARVASYADVVQSVDRAKIVTALERAAGEAGRSLDVLLQVSLDDADGRGGVSTSEVSRLADLVADCSALTLRGVMAVAPLHGDPRRAFAALRTVADGIRADHRDADWISAGMSGDLEAAIAEGATHLRVGTAILGSRQSLG